MWFEQRDCGSGQKCPSLAWFHTQPQESSNNKGGTSCDVAPLQGSEGLGGPGKNLAWTKVLAAERQGFETGAGETRKGFLGGARRVPREKISYVSRRFHAKPRSLLTALGFGKLCLRLPSGAWSQLPSADGTELAGLSTGRQRPGEAAAMRPRAPNSRDLPRKARGLSPAHHVEAAPRPSPAGEREGDGEAAQLRRQRPPRKAL